MKQLVFFFCLTTLVAGATSVGFDTQRERKLWVTYRSFTQESERAAQFAAMGIADRCFFAANTCNAKGGSYCDYPPIWLGIGKYDWAALDAQMEDVLRASPNARLICIIDLNTPYWATHLLSVDSFTDLTHAACEDKWRTMTEKWMLDFIAYTERKWGRHIGAYMLSGGSTSEWYEFDKGRTSEKKDAAWVAWCQARGLDYGKSVPSRSTLANAAFENIVYDPATEPEKIEYWKFHNSLPADALLGFAKAARAAIPKEKELGAFFGYFFVGAPRYTSYGHLACARVLGSPDLDFFSAPGNYEGRSCGGGSGSPLVDGTILRYGKRFLHEIDFGTHDQSRWNPGDSTSLADDLAIHTREAAFAMSKNASYWWFDMWGEFYRDPALRERIAALRRVQEKLPDAPSVSQVLLVADQESLYCVNERAEGVKAFGRHLRNELAKTGAPYDTCSFADLSVLDLSSYRLIILNSTVLITPERERMLREKVFTAGRTILWTYAPGLSDGRTLDVGRVRRFAGVDYGTPGISVTTMGEPALRSLGEGGWTSVYAHDYKLYTTSKLSEIETRAGVHRYVEPCTPVFAKENMVAVHTREGGDLIVKLLRKAARVTDLLTGDVMATDAEEFRTSFAAPDTRIFKVDYE